MPTSKVTDKVLSMANDFVHKNPDHPDCVGEATHERKVAKFIQGKDREDLINAIPDLGAELELIEDAGLDDNGKKKKFAGYLRTVNNKAARAANLPEPYPNNNKTPSRNHRATQTPKTCRPPKSKKPVTTTAKNRKCRTQVTKKKSALDSAVNRILESNAKSQFSIDALLASTNSLRADIAAEKEARVLLDGQVRERQDFRGEQDGRNRAFDAHMQEKAGHNTASNLHRQEVNNRIQDLRDTQGWHGNRLDEYEININDFQERLRRLEGLDGTGRRLFEE